MNSGQKKGLSPVNKTQRIRNGANERNMSEKAKTGNNLKSQSSNQNNNAVKDYSHRPMARRLTSKQSDHHSFDQPEHPNK